MLPADGGFSACPADFALRLVRHEMRGVRMVAPIGGSAPSSRRGERKVQRTVHYDKCVPTSYRQSCENTQRGNASAIIYHIGTIPALLFISGSGGCAFHVPDLIHNLLV